MVKNLIMDKNNAKHKRQIYLSKLSNLVKDFKFFNVFVIIGFFSILLELIAYNFFLFLKIENNFSDFFALLIGICFAFYFNFFYNFEIHKSKIIKAFVFFFLISLFSWIFQKLFSNHFMFQNLSYEATRLLTSACFFLIGYFFHRRLSFSEFKKVGIAFYLDRKLNLKKIFSVIGNNSNFIHIDIVDKSFSKNKLKNDISVLSEIKKIWPNHEIQTHIMSKRPTIILKEVLKYSDVIFIHYEIDESLNKLRKKIEGQNVKFGVAITLNTPPNKILSILKKATNLLILTVDDPGFSGQKFNFKAFDYIDYFNKVKFRKNFRICIDGGVDKNIIKTLNVDDVVSNSAILSSNNPAGEIIKFQSTKYND